MAGVLPSQICAMTVMSGRNATGTEQLYIRGLRYANCHAVKREEYLFQTVSNKSNISYILRIACAHIFEGTVYSCM